MYWRHHQFFKRIYTLSSFAITVVKSDKIEPWSWWSGTSILDWAPFLFFSPQLCSLLQTLGRGPDPLNFKFVLIYFVYTQKMFNLAREFIQNMLKMFTDCFRWVLAICIFWHKYDFPALFYQNEYLFTLYMAFSLNRN